MYLIKFVFKILFIMEKYSCLKKKCLNIKISGTLWIPLILPYKSKLVKDKNNIKSSLMKSIISGEFYFFLYIISATFS
jgi:hypothetical protein